MIALIPFALAATLMQALAPACEFARRGSRTSTSGTHIDSDDNGGTSPVISFVHSDGTRCMSAVIVGRLEYTDAEDDVVDVPFGGHATFSERAGGDERELTITRGESGVIRLYRHNGSAAPFDDSARRWLAGFLPGILMNAGINVGPRVARWRAQGGTESVLSHIATIKSSGAKREHYLTLMSGDRLSAAELDNLVRQAAENVPSSGDLRAILEKAAPTQRGGVRSGSALESAITHMASSGDKTAVLELYGQTTDRGMLVSVMRMAKTIQGSGDKAGLLENLASRYLGNTDRELYTSYFQTAQTIPSSGDLRNLLDAAIPFVAKMPEQASMLMDAARSIASSGDRADVLISLVESGAVKGAPLREKFFDIASTVPSSGDRSRVLHAAARY
ncbi:MAG: hypothetical protein ABIY52_06030 [Gemmatimonadaceae bacterium]